MTTVEQLVAQLRALRDPAGIQGQRRFGITPRAELLGIGVTPLRRMARPLRGDHALALALWETGVHEARHLAAMIDDPAQVTRGQMERWARDFDSWDITDGCCWGLFDRTRHAVAMAERWSSRRAEFVRRGAFAIMAGLAVHDKAADDGVFIAFLPFIEGASDDDRPYVRKGVNWALRQIGKRNRRLNAAAVRCAERVRARGGPAARWIAADALRELRSEAVRARLRG